jgi:hypothetical protein
MQARTVEKSIRINQDGELSCGEISLLKIVMKQLISSEE